MERGFESINCRLPCDQTSLCECYNKVTKVSQKLVKLGYSNVVEFGGINDWKGEIEK